VLGNGTLALILDIAATATRAGVKPTEQEAKEIAQPVERVEENAEASFMVFEDRVKERTALPLEVVERIESVPLAKIEHAGGRILMQYRGELLPLRDDGGLLAELDANGSMQDEMVTVLICSRTSANGQRRTGMVVRRVLDVSTGKLLDKDASIDGMELALVKERVTMVHGASETWEEVA
ncbi:MAG TPA: chemotaxis protein CheA, partial [Edaphobacter sp.]|nr:chemotaxis protein CheA [Edaphobacter sp.]